jgi:hypothetical protein
VYTAAHPGLSTPAFEVQPSQPGSERQTGATNVNLSWTLPWTLHLGAALYALNLGVGLGAQLFHLRFGAAHHWLYALVFAAAFAATAFAFHPALLLTLLALALMPKTEPRTPAHPLIAGLGALGYLGAYLL